MDLFLNKSVTYSNQGDLLQVHKVEFLIEKICIQVFKILRGDEPMNDFVMPQSDDFLVQPSFWTSSSDLSVIANSAIQSAQTVLQGFASAPDLMQKLEIAYGTNFNRNTASQLFHGIASGDFSVFASSIQILSADMLKGANGAFAAETGTIYLNGEFVAANAGNIDAITGVFVEEFGHSIDPQINTVDSSGDEGEIFASIAQGKDLNETELSRMKAEDDSISINLNGKETLLETNVTISGRVISSVKLGSDFDGDGDSDILWRNSNTGETHIWKINAATMTAQSSAVLSVVPSSSGWSVSGTGDFDGDGDSDILWRNSNTGETHIWKINAATMTAQSSAVLSVVPSSSGWSVSGTGDFDGDGDSDILWRNSNTGETHIWKINAATMTAQSSAVLSVVPSSSGWSVSGTGDFDGDGDSDILWRNSNTGETHIWKINAATMTAQSSAVLSVVPPSSGWSVSGFSSTLPSAILPPVMSFTDFNNWRNLPEFVSMNPFPDKGQNCTWYTYGRMLQLGYKQSALDTMRGNAKDWDNTAGNGAYVSSTPLVGSIAVWEPGSSGVPLYYPDGKPGNGHVAVVERVNSDGTILISESNWAYQTYGTRTILRNTPSKFVIVPKA